MEVVDEIRSHLAEVFIDPVGKLLDEKLLEKFDGQVTGVHPAMPRFRKGLRSSNVTLLTVCRGHYRIGARQAHSAAR